jgi:DNA-binding MarR family transcriptional regulator/predicted GNAT family N-acyltransferase
MEDILADLGPIALGSRLKRLADRFLADATLILQRADLPIQSAHVGLLAALDKRGSLSIGDLAEVLGVSQPGVTRSVAALEKLGLVVAMAHDTDARVRRLSLTGDGKAVMARIRAAVWSRLPPVVSALCDGEEKAFLTMIAGVEQRISEQSMVARVENVIKIIPWAPEHARAFHDINIAWIQDMYVVEAHDREVLENPQQMIMDRGGDILFAQLENGEIAGTCALMPADDDALELTKMGVIESVRGKKVGEFLLDAVIQRAKKMPFKTLFLLSNKKAEAAVHLYEKLGFRHDAEIMAHYGASYDRCNVAMRYPGFQ